VAATSSKDFGEVPRHCMPNQRLGAGSESPQLSVHSESASQLDPNKTIQTDYPNSGMSYLTTMSSSNHEANRATIDECAKVLRESALCLSSREVNRKTIS